MSAWVEWWYGDGKKEEYESSLRMEEAPRSSLIDRILGVNYEERDDGEGDFQE
jgi:hypothetical protein